MSAFVGFLSLNGEQASASVGATMLDRLRHRVDDDGWNARQVRAQGSVCLGSAVLDSTPWARFEREQPNAALSLKTSDGKIRWFAGDVRLDAREELCRLLELAEEAHHWNDGRLILEAYARFGEDTPNHLKGDFAFAIWDESRHTLFCARDRFGVRPFYFAFVPGHVLAFANEIKALWPALPFEPRPDDGHVADYLAGAFPSFSRTFYQGIQRLPPAHTLTLDLSTPTVAPRQTAYFTLEGEEELILDSDAEYATRLRAAFESSVRERVECSGRLSLFLSGGLDSSSVAAVATRQTPPAKHPILALSMVFDRFKECDERRWIEPNLKAAPQTLQREWLWGDDIGALNDIERVVWHLDGPPPGPNTCSAWAQYPPLQRAGARVVLDGHGGDEVVYLGYERIGELVAARRLKEAHHELRLLRRHGITDMSAMPLLWAHWGQKARGTRFIGRLTRVLSSRLSPRDREKRETPAPSESDEAASIVRQLVREEKRQLLPSPTAPPQTPSVRDHHRFTLTNSLQPVALEAMDALAGAHALEVRIPFWEEELITLCLSFPSDQKLRHGWNRWVMRRAMQGLLPPSVQWRRAKTNFASQMIEGLRTIERERVEAQLSEPGLLSEWVDIEHARSLWAELSTLSTHSARAANIAFALWRVLALGAWLKSFSETDEGIAPNYSGSQ